MAHSVVIERPKRWDAPTDPEMTEADVDRILAIEPFASMDPETFPPTVGLRDIIRFDTQILRYGDGDIIIRSGDFGTTAFLIMSGNVRVVLPPGLPDHLLGRGHAPRKGVLGALSQLWTNAPYPEARDPARYDVSRGTGARRIGVHNVSIYLRNTAEVIKNHRTIQEGAGNMFGEIAALSRSARMTTVFADGEPEVLQIRRQAIRDIRRYVPEFRKRVDEMYRERSLVNHLQETPMFAHLDQDTLSDIASKTLFETYGDFDWHVSYKRMLERSLDERLAAEPLIVQEGDYPDGLLMVRQGFARISHRVNHGHLTERYIGHDAIFGFDEIVHNWRAGNPVGYQNSLRAVGYTDILRVPTSIIEDLVLPTIPAADLPPPVEPRRVSAAAVSGTGNRREIEPSMLETMVENRYINGTATMLIDTDRCVRCDACVEACAKGHDNNPRFARHGRTFDHFMIANACMHCNDPVCMIGCPTGAIHRSPHGGQVVINDDTCIGCATCATNCPYDNIRMVDVRDRRGAFILDKASGAPIAKATKCDLCVGQPGGPACQRACPHDALVRVDMAELETLAEWLHR